MIERLTIHRESMFADLSINPKFREEILISHTNTHCSSEVQPRGCRIIAIVDIVAAYCEMHPRDTVLEKERGRGQPVVKKPRLKIDVRKIKKNC